MKQSEIQIRDAKLKGASGFRVKSVAKNGEILQTSKVLESVKAVKTHVAAMGRCWRTLSDTILYIVDHTRDQKFVKSGYASSPKLDKLKFTKQK